MDGVSTLLNSMRFPAPTLHLAFEMQQVTFAPEHHIWGEVWKIDADAAPKQAAMKLCQIFGQFFPDPDGSRIGHAMIVLELTQSQHRASLPVLDDLFGEPEIEPQAPVDAMQIRSRCQAELLLTFPTGPYFSQVKKMDICLKTVRTHRPIWPSNLIQPSLAG